MHQAIPYLYDNEIIAKHRDGDRHPLAAERVDDIKVTGSPKEKIKLRQCLEDAFCKGELNVSEGTFTCCGTRQPPMHNGGYELD
eukprot:843229-Pyramimonas_sp.AAC.1